MACDCVGTINSALAEHNGRLCETLMLRPSGVRPTIMVEKIKPRGKSPPVALPTFCPFCGTRYEPKPDASTQETPDV